jgi:hypothetical protein
MSIEHLAAIITTITGGFDWLERATDRPTADFFARRLAVGFVVLFAFALVLASFPIRRPLPPVRVKVVDKNHREGHRRHPVRANLVKKPFTHSAPSSMQEWLG